MHLPRSVLNLADHLGHYIKCYLLLMVMLLAVLAYYRFEWGTFSGFVSAIDHDAQFMKDFVAHYYPMGRQILRVPAPVYGYYYTSFFALMLAPIGLLALPSAMVVWGTIQFACLAAMCIAGRGLLKLSPLGMVLYAGICVTSFPVLHNIKWGQVSVPVTLCVIAAFIASYKNMRVLAGILLAFATAIKFYPIFFIVYFIFKRDARACVSFGVAGLLFYFVFPAAILGFSNWLGFERDTAAAINNADWITQDVNSQYIAHVGLRWVSIAFGRAGGHGVEQVLAIAGYIIALSCVAMVWMLQRRGAGERCRLSMVAIFLSIPFVVKTAWPHYFVYLPLCQVALFAYFAALFRASGWLGKTLIALPIFSMLLSSVFLFNLFPGWSVYNSYGMLFFSNLLLLIELYATVFLQPQPGTAECDVVMQVVDAAPGSFVRKSAASANVSGSG